MKAHINIQISIHIQTQVCICIDICMNKNSKKENREKDSSKEMYTHTYMYMYVVIHNADNFLVHHHLDGMLKNYQHFLVYRKEVMSSGKENNASSRSIRASEPR